MELRDLQLEHLSDFRKESVVRRRCRLELRADTTTDDEQKRVEMGCMATLCRPLTDVAFSIDARYVGRQATDDVDLLAGHMVFMLA